MRRVCFAFSLLLSVLVGAEARAASTVILVRHAEKAAEPANDPPLTIAGEKRAEALADMLAGVPLRAIFVTNTVRSRATAKQVAARMRIEPRVIDAVPQIVAAARAQDGTVLIVGHSNTLGDLIAQLGGDRGAVPSGEMADAAFDNFYVLSIAGASVNTTRLRYGSPSTADNRAAQQAIQREVREVVAKFFQSIRDGDKELGAKFYARGIEFYSPGGTTVPRGTGATAARWLPYARRSNFVRHVQMIQADVAEVVGVWKDPDASPTLTSGLFQFTLTRGADGWRFLIVRDGFLQPVPRPPAGSEARMVSTAGEWRSLFDGKTSQGWVSLTGGEKLPSSWKIEDGCLVTTQTGDRASIRTRDEFRNYELAFEWTVSARGNSGVKYRLFGLDVFGGDGVPHDATGFEYQVADDDGDPGARVDDRQKSGALYSVVAVTRRAAKPVGEWNESRLVVRSDHVEHWLNGVETARYAVDRPFASPILLQHHNTVVKFRGLKIRELP